MNDSQKDILEAAKMDLQKYIVLNDFKQVESYMGFFKKYNKPEGLNYSIKSISEPLDDDDEGQIIWEESPLQTASEIAVDLDIINLLLENGADPNYTNDRGNALHFAIENYNPVYIAILELLLNKGASPYVRDQDNETPYDIAKNRDDKKAMEIFVDHMNKTKQLSKIQRKFKKRTRKRNVAAKSIQSRMRGNLSRQRLTRKKAWKGTNAFDPIMYDDEDIFEYLQTDPKNFVIQLPGSDSYEAMNLNDLLKMSMNKDLYDYFNLGSYNTFYECHKYDIHDYQKGSKNVDANTQYMKIGIANFVVLVPNWFFGNFGYKYERYPIPEPRIFKLEKLKVVNSLVSSKLYHYLDKLDEIALIKYNVEVEEAIRDNLPQEEIDMMEPDWPLVSADHCNEKNPIQVYQLVPVHTHEDDYLADFANELKQFSSQSSEMNRSSGVPRRLFHSNSSNSDPSNSSNSDLTRRFNALQDIDPSLQPDEEFRNLNLS
tara:strand:- start:422 stop:1879 length:1458 start_codon:yes stop_codon:yes gene_type:complete